MIRAACALYQISKDPAYLAEAERIAKAAEKFWARPGDGIFHGAGKLNVKLVEAFFDLYDVDHNDHWLAVNARCLTSLRQHRNALGWYPQNWEAAPLPDNAPARLIDQAAPALGYWLAAAHGVKPAR